MERDEDRLSELLSVAFDEGLDPAESAALASMPPARRRKLEARLAAILAFEVGGGSDRDVAALAASAGLRSSHFYKLLRDWSASRSLAVLGVRVGASATRASALGAAAAAATERVREIVRDDPGASTSEVLRIATAGLERPPSRTTLLRILRDARRRFAKGRFGERIVFDSAGLDLLDPEGLRVRLYAVLDGGTGLVLGWFEGTARSGAGGYVWAAHDAMERLRDLVLPPVAVFDGRPALDVRLDPQDEAGADMLSALDREPPPGHPAERRLGAALVRALGDRVGGVWLGAGSRPDGVGFRTGRPVHLPPLTAELSDRIADGVATHNRETLDLTPRTGSPQAVLPAIERVRSRIGEIDAFYGAIVAADDRT